MRLTLTSETVHSVSGKGSKNFVLNCFLNFLRFCDPNADNKRVFIDLKGNPDFRENEVPDGMTIDKSGRLWVGLYGGGRVVQINTSTGITFKHN